LPEAGVGRLGRRNILYVLFVLLTIGSAILVETTGAGGTEGPRLVATLIWFWGIGSIGFFVVNAVLLMLAVVKGVSPRKAAIACALPTGLVILLLILAQFLPA
jgi:hypothetical protein